MADSIVIQTFRNHDIPAWIQRCLDSVRSWAELHGHEYSLAGDEFYQLCGQDYLARGPKNPQAITNLARLVATRNRLDEGYQKVIWMDADMFVFDPKRLVLDFRSEQLSTGYAFAREIWLERNLSVSAPLAHNAATFFTPAAVDLDMLITLIRHIDAGRQIVSNFQLGVRLLRGLQYSLMFPTFSHAAMFSPRVSQALVDQDAAALKIYCNAYRYPSFAANLCLSLQHRIDENTLWRAMDRLGETRGEAINQYAPEPAAALIAYDQ